jgi:hypothetical protein
MNLLEKKSEITVQKNNNKKNFFLLWLISNCFILFPFLTDLITNKKINTALFAVYLLFYFFCLVSIYQVLARKEKEILSELKVKFMPKDYNWIFAFATLFWFFIPNFIICKNILVFIFRKIKNPIIIFFIPNLIKRIFNFISGLFESIFKDLKPDPDDDYSEYR